MANRVSKIKVITTTTWTIHIVDICGKRTAVVSRTPNKSLSELIGAAVANGWIYKIADGAKFKPHYNSMKLDLGFTRDGAPGVKMLVVSEMVKECKTYAVNNCLMRELNPCEVFLLTHDVYNTLYT